MNYGILFEEAIKARDQSYSPYSKFAVGAALLCDDGTIYTGCNVENAAFTPTCCAERIAFYKAVSDSKTNFRAIAIAGGGQNKELDDFCPPCGVCRQVMLEFCNPDTFDIVLGPSAEKLQVYKLSKLMPLGFGPNNLN